MRTRLALVAEGSKNAESSSYHLILSPRLSWFPGLLDILLAESWQTGKVRPQVLLLLFDLVLPPRIMRMTKANYFLEASWSDAEM